MAVLPGSHKGGALPHINVTDDYIVPADRYDMARVVPLPMAPGSALFFHSLLLHGTAANRSPLPRRAAIMAYMAAEYRYTGTPPKPHYLRISGEDVPGGV